MKKIAIVITIIVMASCKQKTLEILKDKQADEIVNRSAIADIANQLEALDNNIIIAQDSTKNPFYRNIAIAKIRSNNAEFLDSLTIENLAAPDFAKRLENQKQFIISNCRQMKRNRQYTQLVVEQGQQ